MAVKCSRGEVILFGDRPRLPAPLPKDCWSSDCSPSLEDCWDEWGGGEGEGGGRERGWGRGEGERGNVKETGERKDVHTRRQES